MTTMTAPPIPAPVTPMPTMPPPPTLAPRRYTPEDLLQIPDAENYELVDGVLVERTTSAESSRVALRIGHLLISHCDRTAAGDVFGPDLSYQCFPQEAGMIRRPDVSFIRAGRLAGPPLPEGHIRVAPDLAVEVLSPNDLIYDVAEKVEQYLAAGVRVVWVVHPIFRTVQVNRADGSLYGLRVGGTISGEDALAGFSCPVQDFFPSPPTPAIPPADDNAGQPAAERKSE